ncbi:UDP-N-acetylmuramate dehydrogenase [candidate division KSB1 bacterium]|nr:UDP-N-acetylmuramate dehydrogenase [candidate division KSB1 bacterium]RQW05690.1 MAG: UDP-N-acetylmuramate dehydrogenase [candidate division KSB1 bacterium]
MKASDFPPNYTIQENVALADFTNIKIGGPADYLSVVTDQKIFVDLYRHCLAIGLRFLALGDGTNVFFSEGGFHGLVAIIKFDNTNIVAKNAVVAEAGASLEQILALCIENGLTGFEFTAGIPGTIGGAVYGNAGAYGSNVGALLTRAKILTASGEIIFVEHDFFKFSYRHSDLKVNPAIVLQAELQLAKGDAARIKSECDEIIAMRRMKLPPPDTLTAGSWFKNIKDDQGNATAAALYLDAIGARKMSVGDAAVHEKHANIFYNKGNATATDMLTLQQILQERVYRQFGVMLEREVMYVE